MHDNRSKNRDNDLKFCTKRVLFADCWLQLGSFLLFSFFNFSCLEHVDSLQVISQFWKFFVILKACFFHFWFSAPTHFPEVICPRYNPAYLTLADIEKGSRIFPDFPDLPDHVEILLKAHQCKFENFPLCSNWYKNNTLKSSHSYP